MYRALFLCCLLLLVVIGAAISLPTAAQEPLFVTNTPRPIMTTPAAPMSDYGLRRWQENDLLNLLQTHAQQLTSGAAQAQQVVRLLQYELQRRFPAAPRDPDRRDALIDMLLNAPAGSVDLRPFARPHVAEALNLNLGETAFRSGRLMIEVLPARLDSAAPPDAVIYVRARSGSQLLYEDYLLARVDAQGRYSVLPNDLPAAPFGEIKTLALKGINDFNGDGVEELAVSAQTDGLNQRLYIVGGRGSLVEPGQTILFGEIVRLDRGGIEVKEYRVESAAWGCLGERIVTWKWDRNFFRPVPDDGYFYQNSAACLFYGLEPYFDVPAGEAIRKLDSVLALAPPDDPGAQRARLMRAMLDAVNGDLDAAGAAVLQLADEAQPGSWLEQQTSAFLVASAQPDAHPVQICAALEAASEYGACQVDPLLQRLFREQPLSRSIPIEPQLAAMGITVLDTFTVSAIGRADRAGVHFDLGGPRWWAFAPLDPEFYTAEQVSRPEGASPLTTPPPPIITAVPEVYDALLVNDDPALALRLLDNLRRESPGAPAAADARYVEALSYDLLGNRETARAQYYALWRDFSQTIWGQLAAAHLQQG